MTDFSAVFNEDWFHYRPRPIHMNEKELLEEIVETNREILRTLIHLTRQENEEMADISQLTTDVATLTSAVSAAGAALDDLATQVANLTAGNVTQDQINALDDSVNAATAALDGAVSKDDPTPTPPAPSA